MKGRDKMKLLEAFNKLENQKFNLNYNINKQYWELVIFTNEMDIAEEYENNHLKYLLQDYLKEKVEFDSNNEPYYFEDYRNIYINYGNTEDEENIFELELDPYFTNSNTKLKDLRDLANRLENLNNEFINLEIRATETLKERYI
ncbi:hypothetical protein RN96_10495 [Fusobacterium polymorphum]|uniref:Uncharacterized protein n=2 Tax=Fusobacterium nucleatum subsp. polymorphum TaxID=76857 RepID=A0A2B7YJ00_FUSNP|nr:hypothetical protein RN96_10495 [Fusobacterium polymorphum]